MLASAALEVLCPPGLFDFPVGRYSGFETLFDPSTNQTLSLDFLFELDNSSTKACEVACAGHPGCAGFELLINDTVRLRGECILRAFLEGIDFGVE